MKLGGFTRLPRGRLGPLRGAVALVSSALLVAVAAGGVTAAEEHPAVTVHAEFTDAGAIIPGNDVMVDGVKAGEVKKLRLVDGKARVTISVGSAFTPLHTDAKVTIRAISLLGERYIHVDRGSPSAPILDDGGIIPATQTSRTIELQEFLDVVNEPAGAALAALIVALGEGLSGRGEDAAAALDALEPALTETTKLLEILGGQNQLLTALIDRAEPVAQALAADRGQRLDKVVAATDQLLAATAAGKAELDGALRRLPTALATARSALAELTALAGQTTPVLASLRPLSGDLRQIATELQNFADAAGPALVSTEPVLQRLRELITAASPVTADLRAAAPDVQAAAKATRTVVEALPEDLSNLLDWVRNAALATAGHDGISHYLRIFALATGKEVGPSEPPETPGATAPAGPPAGPPLAPAPPLGGAPVGPLLGPSTPVVGGLLGGALDTLVGGASPATDPGSATGLTEQQERSLLGYLLGGG
ncbi:MAG: MlaD family protein [Actinomycetota bacterium]|jgi:phospholipid/cholesterol/gamma-HCH transport system substrate-binding protein